MPESPHAVETRFAPNPTGRIHLGNARTPLFNFLFPRHAGERFLLRIEDTDAERSSDANVDALKADRRWLGLDWDEGPDHDAGAVPYHQSLRGDIELGHYQRLLADDSAYPCLRSPEVLAANRKRQLAAGRPPRYDRTCGGLSQGERRRSIDAGEPHTLRCCAGVSGRRLFRPLRIALTGELHGSDIKTLLNSLPPERVSERLSVACNLAASS